MRSNNGDSKLFERTSLLTVNLVGTHRDDSELYMHYDEPGHQQCA